MNRMGEVIDHVMSEINNKTSMIDENIHKASEMDNDTLNLIDDKLHEIITKTKTKTETIVKTEDKTTVKTIVKTDDKDKDKDNDKDKDKDVPIPIFYYATMERNKKASKLDKKTDCLHPLE